MTFRFFVFPLICMLFACSQPVAERPAPDNVKVDTVMEKVYPALVRIFVVSTNYRNGRVVRSQGTGSGTIITPDGYVVTNHHVAGHATRIWCTLPNRERVDAKLVGTDPLTDIAVLKLLPESMRKPVDAFPYASWGDSDTLKVGDEVFAMGSPGALAQSVTYGIVANPSTVMPNMGMELDGEPVGLLVRWIFHDAQIFHGNSGGPLVNPQGEIVGVNEIAAAALGGAIPANIAREVAESLIADGDIMRSWTGIVIQTLLRSDPDDRGALVGGVLDGSPAQAAGLEPGDRIVSVNGEEVFVRFSEQMPDFYRMVVDQPVGTTLKLQILRDGKSMTRTLTTVDRGQAMGEQKEVGSWGITAMDLTRLMRQKLRTDIESGVVVTSINRGGPSGLAKPSLRPRDLILSVEDKEVKNLNELIKVSREITHGKEKAVATVVRFWREGDEMLTSVEIGPMPDSTVPPTVKKPWFPANVQVLTRDLSDTLGLESVKGVRITRLFPQMEDSDFKRGDILTHMDGMQIDAWEPTHEQRFPTMVRRYRPETEVVFSVIREKEKMQVKYVLPASPRPANELDVYKNELFEFAARDLTPMDLIQQRLPAEQKGTLVTEVKSGSWADLGGLNANDIILSLNENATPDLETFQSVMSDIEEKKPEALIFFVKRPSNSLYVEVIPEWPDDTPQE
ncbi:MAG: trypsin-like peptidase domain-containing protein [Candidatus Sumerlaeota bacterium]